MNLRPSAVVSAAEVDKGLKFVIKDGLAAEAMSTLTGGTFLVAMALQLGASNFQIGLLAALPTLTNIFQLLAIWLVQRYNNRRAVAVFGSVLARLPLLVIGLLPFLFSKGTSLQALIFLLFFHYFFGSVAGASWNSWMKDLVPEEKLGSYFSHRTRLTQTLNVVISLMIALALDHVKKFYPAQESTAYALMFLCGSLFGILGAYFLSRAPEPQLQLSKENLFKLFSRPVRDKNFRKLLVFNSFWSFALNLATPFFTVYMMNTVGLPLSYIIGLGLLSQVAGIVAVKFWGNYSDRFSNKTIIRMAAPLYIFCIMAWSFVGVSESFAFNILLIALINLASGMSTSGINLAINNIGMKLAPKEESIVYLSARNMIVAFVSALGPLAGGVLADYFMKRSMAFELPWKHAADGSLRLLAIHDYGFLFLIGSLLALAALRTIRSIREEGETERSLVMGALRVAFKQKMRSGLSKETILSFLSLPVTYPVVLKKKIGRRVAVTRKWNRRSAERRAA